MKCFCVPLKDFKYSDEYVQNIVLSELVLFERKNGETGYYFTQEDDNDWIKGIQGSLSKKGLIEFYNGSTCALANAMVNREPAGRFEDSKPDGSIFTFSGTKGDWENILDALSEFMGAN